MKTDELYQTIKSLALLKELSLFAQKGRDVCKEWCRNRDRHISADDGFNNLLGNITSAERCMLFIKIILDKASSEGAVTSDLTGLCFVVSSPESTINNFERITGFLKSEIDKICSKLANSGIYTNGIEWTEWLLDNPELLLNH